MRALIIDDSSVMRKVIERALRQADIELSEILHADCGDAALKVLREDAAKGETLQLILSDINMPGMDGLTFLEERRKEALAPAARVVMITTEGSQPQVMRAIAAGAHGYLCKPFTADQVRGAVAPLLAAMKP
jgi:two-component system chemotaxis response regulator CheY